MRITRDWLRDRLDQLPRLEPDEDWSLGIQVLQGSNGAHFQLVAIPNPPDLPRILVVWNPPGTPEDSPAITATTTDEWPDPNLVLGEDDES